MKLLLLRASLLFCVSTATPCLLSRTILLCTSLLASGKFRTPLGYNEWWFPARSCFTNALNMSRARDFLNQFISRWLVLMFPFPAAWRTDFRTRSFPGFSGHGIGWRLCLTSPISFFWVLFVQHITCPPSCINRSSTFPIAVSSDIRSNKALTSLFR